MCSEDCSDDCARVCTWVCRGFAHGFAQGFAHSAGVGAARVLQQRRGRGGRGGRGTCEKWLSIPPFFGAPAVAASSGCQHGSFLKLTRLIEPPSRRPSQPRNSSISSSLSRSPIFVKTSVSSSAETLPSCQGAKGLGVKREEKKARPVRGRHGRRGTRQYGEAHFVGVEDPKGQPFVAVDGSAA